jgi:hypothetical protein
MGLTTARLMIDRDSLPGVRNDVGLRFERRSVTTMKAAAPPKDMVIIRPAGDLLAGDAAVGPEPRWNLVMCGIGLKSADGTNAVGSGQLIITGQRLIGMIDAGKAAGAPPLSLATSGHVFCFSLDRDDVQLPQQKKHRLTPSEFFFPSQAAQPVKFQLTVFSAMACIANDKMAYWYDKNMLNAMTPEGRQGLLKA